MNGPAGAGPSKSPAPNAPWPQFAFFDSEQVKDAGDASLNPRPFQNLRPPLVTATASAPSPFPSTLILSSGSDILILDRRFEVVRRFPAFAEDGRCTALAESGGLLVAVGEEGGGALLKVWDLAKFQSKKAGGGPALLKNAKIQQGQRLHPISSVALTSNVSHLAIGLGDGTVLLYRHLLQSLTSSSQSLTSLPKPRVIHESSEPITGLGFCESQAGTTDASAVVHVTLLVTTINRILSVGVAGKSRNTETIDTQGSMLGCVTMDNDRRELFVARDDAVYAYGPEGRTQSLALEGAKTSIAIYGHYLLIVSPASLPAPRALGQAGATSSPAKITIFDLKIKVIAFTEIYREGIEGTFDVAGDICVCLPSGPIHRLQEKSITERLQTLYRRNLYQLALSLAEAYGIGDRDLAEIHRRHGDYLYEKGDFDGAMSQYIHTLGQMPPSYIIRKYLDAQRIRNLMEFLQQLHTRGLATPDHTTLLINCYTKTGDRARLDEFIHNDSGRPGGGDNEDLMFDLDTTIRVCRQAGFFEHASYLAKKWKRHEDYLRIQIEDAGQYLDALSYLRALDPEVCHLNMLLYGRILLLNEPEATTTLLIDLCSGTMRTLPLTNDPLPTKDSSEAERPAAGVLSYIGAQRVTDLISGDSAKQDTRSKSAAVEEPPKTSNGVTKMDEVADAIDSIEPLFDPPSPRLYFYQFVNLRDQFIRFLEEVALKRWHQSMKVRDNGVAPGPPPSEHMDDREGTADQTAIWNTLLELYLNPSGTSSSSSVEADRKKALNLLSDPSLPVDSFHALILCSQANFTDGLVTLWISMGMYEDVIRFWMDEDSKLSEGPVNGSPPSEKMLEFLEAHGQDFPELYTLVLRHLTSSTSALKRHSTALSRVLKRIDELRVLPPLAVIQILARNGNATVGMLKEWLQQSVGETEQELENDKRLTANYRLETETKEQEIKALANPTQPQIFQVTRCAACNTQLDLPSIHFMCKHSYHQRCLADVDPECTLCARQHAIVRELRRGRIGLADRHDLFLQEVHDADNGFDVIAGAFARGILDTNTIHS